MFEFDLQRFDEDAAQDTSAEQPQPQSQEPASEPEPIPEELGGLPEEYAREVMKEAQETQEPEEQSEEPKPQAQEAVPYVRFKEKVDEANRLKAELEEYKRRAQQQPPPQQPPPQQVQPQPQPQPQMPMPQPPPIQITPENAPKLKQAIEAEAMALTGMSKDDVASLEYADDDDPRIVQWQQAKSVAQSNIFNAIRQARFAQQQQAQQFLVQRAASINNYNDYVRRQFAEPDYKNILEFATNEFFESLPQSEQRSLAESYLRVEGQNPLPSDVMSVKNYFELAKIAYRTRANKPPARGKQQPNLPRTDQITGTTTTSDGQLSARDIEKLLEGDFTELTPQQQKLMLGLS